MEQSSKEHLKTCVDIGGIYRPLAPALENEIFRIAQEAISNTVRHAGATRVALDLRFHPNDLTLTISDNGIGFQTNDSNMTQKGHFGLQGMRERANQINGKLSVKSSSATGTIVTLNVPLANGKE
jgi:signal transduction histidine kinase